MKLLNIFRKKKQVYTFVPPAWRMRMWKLIDYPLHLRMETRMKTIRLSEVEKDRLIYKLRRMLWKFYD